MLHGEASKSFFSSSWQNKSSPAPVDKCMCVYIYIEPNASSDSSKCPVNIFKCHYKSLSIQNVSNFPNSEPLRSSPNHVAACCHPSVNTGRRHRLKMTTSPLSTGCATKCEPFGPFWQSLWSSRTVLDFRLCTSWQRILHIVLEYMINSIIQYNKTMCINITIEHVFA